MADSSPYLLNDDAMQRFIVDGYLKLTSNLPREYHTRMYDELEPLDETGPRGHNNLLPCVPELRRMLEEPKIVGALTSILGPNYYLHFHRHDHVNYPDGAQPLHKDSDDHSHRAMDGLRRRHATRHVLLFYYPQDTPIAAGPTGIVPRSQYVTRRVVDRLKKESDQRRGEILQEIREAMDEKAFVGTQRFKRYAEMEREFTVRHPDLVEQIEQTSAPWEEAKIPLTGDAGTITLAHFDIVHGRYTGNVTGKQRHMVKFLFTRNEEPRAPSWRHTSPEWRGPKDDTQSPIWRHIWSWHLGTTDTSKTRRTVDDLTTALVSPDDETAIGSAYELGTTSAGLDVLFGHSLLNAPARPEDTGDLHLRAIAAYGIVRAGEAALPMLLSQIENADADQQVRIVDLLGDMATKAADALAAITPLAASPHISVRRATIEALGMITQQQKTLDAAVIDAFTQALGDHDAIVARNATFAIAQSGAKACSLAIIDGLNANLFHSHHHVRGWSIEALQQLDDPRALSLALRHLSAARWDPGIGG